MLLLSYFPPRCPKGAHCLMMFCSDMVFRAKATDSMSVIIPGFFICSSEKPFVNSAETPAEKLFENSFGQSFGKSRSPFRMAPLGSRNLFSSVLLKFRPLSKYRRCPDPAQSSPRVARLLLFAKEYPTEQKKRDSRPLFELRVAKQVKKHKKLRNLMESELETNAKEQWPERMFITFCLPCPV